MRNANGANRFSSTKRKTDRHDDDPRKRRVLAYKEINLPQKSNLETLQVKHPQTKTMNKASNLTTGSMNDKVSSSQQPPLFTGSTMTSVLLPTRSVGTRQYPNRIQWQGANPMTWIESIAADAEKRESIANGGKVAAPIRMNGMNLSLKRPMSLKFDNKLLGSAVATQETFDLKEDGQRKRVRMSCEDQITHRNEHETRNDHDLQEPAEIEEWNFSVLLNDESQPKRLVQNVQTLALAMEAMESTPPHVKSSYKRIRGHFALELRRIKELQTGTGQAIKVDRGALLRDLYNDTKLKMEALIRMARCETTERTKAATLSPPAGTPVDKKDFANYMSTWLRDNWTNPYPDDDGLSEMATACGTTPTVVSNWLINARTRKWRPAIVKAFENGRPSELLLEDSLNIFDGHPVREIPEEFSSDDLSGCAFPANKRAKNTH